MRNVDTPTRLRNMYGVNSPKVRSKKGTASAFAQANQEEDYEANVPHHLITQVARPDAGGQAGQAGSTTAADSSSQHQDNLKEAEEKNCPCCWFCLPCCNGPLCGSSNLDRNQGPRTELVAADRNAQQMGQKNNAVTLDQLGAKKIEAHPNPYHDGDREISQTDSNAGMDENRDAGGQHDLGAAAGQNSLEQRYPDMVPIPGLLQPKDKKNRGKKCLVLDLDETLVHSSFKPVANADFIVPVEIDGVVYKVYVLKRPFVDLFLTECAKDYEMVIFTASLSKYANPLLDMLDTEGVIEHRLFRESCVLHGQAYVKDLSKLGRRMEDIIFVDNSPLSYAFQPQSAVPILSWFDDPHDTQLRDLLPVLKTTLKEIGDVQDVLDANNKSFEWLCRQVKDEWLPENYARRLEKESREANKAVTGAVGNLQGGYGGGAYQNNAGY